MRGSAQISIWVLWVLHETATFLHIKINEHDLNKCLHRHFKNYLNVQYFILLIYLPKHCNCTVGFKILSHEPFLQLHEYISPHQNFWKKASAQQSWIPAGTDSSGRCTGLINTLGFPPDIWLLWGCVCRARRIRRQAFPSDSFWVRTKQNIGARTLHAVIIINKAFIQPKLND